MVIDHSTIAGLRILRDGVRAAVTVERNKLADCAHEEKCLVSRMRSELKDKRDRLKYVKRRHKEKVETHQLAQVEFNRAKKLQATEHV